MRNVKLTDIAKLAGVSVGTVDRVLHNRGHVAETKRVLVEQAIKELNYKPNLAAQVLASKKSARIMVIIPQYKPGEYWELVGDGINEASLEYSRFNLRIEMVLFDQYKQASFEAALSRALKTKIDGVIISPTFAKETVEFSKTLSEMGIPYVYVDTFLPRQGNLSYVGANTLVSGHVAAKLLFAETGGDADFVLCYIKHEDQEISLHMQERAEGFKKYCTDHGFTGNILRIDINPDNPELGIDEFTDVITRCKGNVGVAVLNSRIHQLVGIVNSIPEHIRQRLRMVGYDAIRDNIQALKIGEISYLISQRTKEQGYMAVKLLFDYLFLNRVPYKTNFVSIDILIRETVAYYDNFKHF